MKDVGKFAMESAHPKRVLIFDFDQTLCTLYLPWEIYKQRMIDNSESSDGGAAKATGIESLIIS